MMYSRTALGTLVMTSHLNGSFELHPRVYNWPFHQLLGLPISLFLPFEAYVQVIVGTDSFTCCPPVVSDISNLCLVHCFQCALFPPLLIQEVKEQRQT